jgi:Cytochrome P460
LMSGPTTTQRPGLMFQRRLAQGMLSSITSHKWTHQSCLKWLFADIHCFSRLADACALEKPKRKGLRPVISARQARSRGRRVAETARFVVAARRAGWGAVMTSFRICIVLWVGVLSTSGALQSKPSQQIDITDAPQYTSDGKLKLPEDYRQWVYVSSGFGMSYSDNPQRQEPVFDNVFVKRDSYDHFLRTGAWPDRTMFVLELRESSDHGSIVKNGRFQASLSAIEASVKDERRFPEKWAYFDFGADGKEAPAFPKEARCFSCHQRNGAVDNTFIQFYPTLRGSAGRTPGFDR